MKNFVIGGIVGMVIMLGIVIFVWMTIQSYFKTAVETQSAAAPSIQQTDNPGQESSSNTVPSNTESSIDLSNEESFRSEPATPPDSADTALMTGSDLALTPEQRALAESFGIDVANIVITQATLDCAENQLGTERLDEILAGATPTAFESLRLLGCL